MSNIIGNIIKRLLSLILTLLITTMVLYATVMLTPPETRASLFISQKSTSHRTEEQLQQLIQRIIVEKHLKDPFYVQYYYWVSDLLKGNWGYSNVLQEDVFEAISRRAPVTAELTLYSLLIFIPLGLISGVVAGSRKNQPIDHGFRLFAYIAASLPSFILALILLATFYIDLYWFAPGRMSDPIQRLVTSDNFRTFTGLLTIDGLLNGQPKVSLDALRHLAMPVITLTLTHWSTLGRITRASMIEENQQDYAVAARAHGVSESRITWRHLFPNAFAPALTSSILSAASLITGVFVVEIIFNIHGISDIAVSSMQNVPDAPAALGFTIYSVFVVFLLMTLLDILQSILDPRVRKGAR